MAMISLTATSNTNVKQTLSLENRNNLRDASFSSYLNSADETFVLKLAEPGQNVNFLVSNPHEHLYIGRKKVEDGEIDVFGAEKYFNDRVVDKENPKIANTGAIISHQEKDELVLDIGSVKQKTQPGPPSIRSESSWNSQIAILHSIPKNKTRRMAKKVQGKSFLAGIGCNCACNDKSSVEIDEQNGENSSCTVSAKNGIDHGKGIAKKPFKTSELLQMNKFQTDCMVKKEMQCHKFDKNTEAENRFSFPVLNTKEGDQIVKRQSDDISRKSLDVFGSPILRRGKKSLSLERRLTMLTWDETEIWANSNGIYNDIESDTSSDLFEIESLSTNGNGNDNAVLTRQEADGIGMSSCFTPGNYAPSEASVEWSVVTASAADFSVTSDSEERKTASSGTNLNRKLLNANTEPDYKEMQKRRPSILMSCKNHKAVRVVGDVYRTNEKGKS